LQKTKSYTATKRGEFSAIGVYNQYIYVDPVSRTLLVKLSANPAYGTSEDEDDNKDEKNMALLQAISHPLNSRLANGSMTVR
jgi:CubicO group peptidase (beta-lactamase class C family)